MDHHRLIGSAALALLVGAGGLAAITPVRADTGVQILPETVPNYFLNSTGDPVGKVADIFADPTNHLLFETDVNDSTSGMCGGGLDPVYALDSETYHLRAQGCLGNRAGGAGAGTTTSPVVAIDSADHLIFYSDGVADSQVGPVDTGPKDGIVALSEDTLKVVGRWSVPSDARHSIAGLSWYAPKNQLIVMTTDSGWDTAPPPQPGVELAAIDVAASLRGGHSHLLWSDLLPTQQCWYPLYDQFATVNAYRSQNLPELFLGCGVGPEASLTHQPQPSVLAVPMTTTGCPTGADACPVNSGIISTAVPGQAEDFVFDPLSDRAFMPEQDNSGTTLLVYDGVHHLFAGRMSVAATRPGQANPYFNDVGFGLDPIAGRVYAVGGGGMFLSDGRRTPVAPGTTDAAIHGDVFDSSLAVLPPTSGHPYNRIIVNFCDRNTDVNTCRVSRFTVVADGTPVTIDPPPAHIDGNTASGPIPAGSSAQTVFAGSARAFGAHVDLVGGANGVVNDTTDGVVYNNPALSSHPLPFATGNRDVIAGLVGHLELRGGSARGDARALEDPSNVTAPDYERCTNLQVVLTCLDSKVPPSNKLPQTGQPWPFSLAVCNQPGAASDARQQQSGFTANQPNHGAGSQTVPGSDVAANASVDCAAPQGTAQGVSSLRDVKVGPESGGAPHSVPATVAIGEAVATTSVSPPEAGRGVATSADAAARGVRIDLGNGNSLSFGEVRQSATTTAAGVAGSARTTRTVLLANVEVTVAGKTIVVCSGPCTKGVADVVARLNSLLPATLAILAPQPQSFYAKGSPGGYISAIEADVSQQYGDQQFNGMSAGEAAFLPAIRIVTYYDSSSYAPYQLSRQIIDLAGVDVDTEQGIQVIPPAGASTGLAVTPVVVSAAASVSGYTPPAAVTSSFDTGSAGLGDTTTPATSSDSAGILQRTFDGFRWLARSPRQALQMFAFLCMLGLPLVLMARRHSWLRGLRPR